MRNLFKIIFLSGLFVNVLAKPVLPGVDYTILSTAGNTSAAMHNKIDIKEFFSFTCIHCKDVEPLLEASIAKQKNINLERIQVPWDAKTTQLAKLNATYQLMGLNRLYVPTFDAIFTGQDLTDTEVLTQFLQKNKVNVKLFMSNYNSFTVSAAPGQYKNLMMAYNVDGTPTFVVADKYVLKPAMPQRIIEVLQYLIQQNKVK